MICGNQILDVDQRYHANLFRIVASHALGTSVIRGLVKYIAFIYRRFFSTVLGLAVLHWVAAICFI
jgi:hypothetical protein